MNSRHHGVGPQGRPRPRKMSRFDSPKPERNHSDVFYGGPSGFPLGNQVMGGAPFKNQHFNNAQSMQNGNVVNIWTENEDSSYAYSRDSMGTFNAPTGEDEPCLSEDFVTLDWYNSDLNLEIHRGHFCGGNPFSKDGFGYMWAGARASHGILRGKVCYEVQITSKNDVSHLIRDEQDPHLLRCGWSIDESGLQLGEEGFSYGYDATGKAVLSNKFENYGRPFGLGDVIGCFLDLTSDPVSIGFTLNGEFQGVAFSVPRSLLSGRALFPHILTKNQEFTVNFGQMAEPLMSPIIPSYIHIGQLDMSEGLMPGNKAPKAREDCEVLLLVGLPGSGKSFFAEDHKIKNPEKRYNILGVSSILEKMTCHGVDRRRFMEGQSWDSLVKVVMEIMGVLIKMAPRRRRNYILDQANVNPQTRQRKMLLFQGFARTAFVLVPPLDVYNERLSKSRITPPHNVLMNSKANFILPEALETSYFNAVTYMELGPREAYRIVEAYNNEAYAAGFNCSKAVEDFLRESNKYREVKGIKGPVGRILNDIFHGVNKFENEVPPSGFQGGDQTSSAFPQKHRPPFFIQKTSDRRRSYEPNEDYHNLPHQQTLPKGGHPEQRYSNNTNNNSTGGPSMTDGHDSDIEIVKELSYPTPHSSMRPRGMPNNVVNNAPATTANRVNRSRSRSPGKPPFRGPGGYTRRNDDDDNEGEGYRPREETSRDLRHSYYSRRNIGDRGDGSIERFPENHDESHLYERRDPMQNRSMAPKERLNPPLRTESSNEQYLERRRSDDYHYSSFNRAEPSSSLRRLQEGSEDRFERSGFSKDYHGDTYDPFESSEGQSSGGVVSYPIYSKSINVPPAPHIRPLPEASSRKAPRPFNYDDRHERATGHPAPVPPVSRFEGHRSTNSHCSSYPNISYPKY